MLRRTLISIGALGAFTVLAFGSGDSSGSSDFSNFELPAGGGQANLDACTAYVEHFNALPCVSEEIHQKVENTCAGQADIPAETKPMWDCMTQAAMCKDGIINMEGQTECRDKIVY